MKFTIFLTMAVFFGTPLSWAKEFCRPANDLRNKVVYCDQNFDYYEAAKACKNKFLQHVKKEQAIIQAAIAAQAALSTDSAQKEKLDQSGQVLASLITKLGTLIHYGKEVHTEIEDYVYDLVLPAFNEAEAKANIEDPKVLAEFMRRECYGDPHRQMELMQKEIRPVIADLEKTMAEAVALEGVTGQRGRNLDSLNHIPVQAAPVPGRNAGPASAPKRPDYRPSDISGTEDLEP